MIFMDSSIVFYNNDHVRAKHSIVHYNIVFSLKSTTQLYKPFKKKKTSLVKEPIRDLLMILWFNRGWTDGRINDIINNFINKY